MNSRRRACWTLMLAVLALDVLPASATELPRPTIAAAAALGDPYPERRSTFPGSVIGLPDLTYQMLPGFRPLTLDVYRPSRQAPAAGWPLILYIHGGGWMSGHSRQSGAFENWPGVLASIAARGYVIASLNYRLSSEASFPAAIQDVKAALRWLRANATRFGIDKARALTWGGSAGGHLAALAATSCGESSLNPVTTRGTEAQSDCVQGAIAWYGVFDFRSMQSPQAAERSTDAAAAANDPTARFLGCAVAYCPRETLRLADPLQQVGPKTPPILLIHGIEDRTVPVQQSKDFLAALQAAGVKAELITLPDVGHSFVGADQRITEKASLEALDRSLAFIDALFKP
jgi:acetyl esterase/lipase